MQGLMQPGAADYGVVLITAASEAEAREIASTLVQEQLAACATLFPVQSVYAWKGEICSEPEWQLLVKTDLARFDAIASRVCELHSYELPEILALPIAAGLPPYLTWIGKTLRPLE
ncbi:uncharacterized protein KR51_00036130 [Rubidibacter lacunae KORDI 51-2]|uniref:Divalent-cation tolerance protein CutA n=1 Tax=Rubidibacter lacunae KORDI 51-2 TaxID=582515 RepID=U5DF24_9CHRO|nr:divalent-cation tolerance protein CutA [Rubidibacter lacunae]ERN39912.1 uncharacterized protein KR51_00036130 [Rubidibacter lacunae KORDI 51-2]